MNDVSNAFATGSPRLSRRLIVPMDGPLDIAGSLEFFRRHGDDLIDRWDGTTLVRTVPLDGGRTAVAMSPAGTVDRPELAVTFARDAGSEADVRDAVRAQFLTGQAELCELTARDPVIAELDRRHRGIRTLIQPDVLHMLVRLITAQQINLAWAITTRARLVRLLGTSYTVAEHTTYALEADALAGASVRELRELQLSTRKAEYLISTATAVARGELDDLATLSDAEVMRRLMALRGIGQWSADWLLARTLGRARVAAGDLAVRKAVGLAYGHRSTPDIAETRRLTAHWGPSATVAQQLVLEHAALHRDQPHE